MNQLDLVFGVIGPPSKTDIKSVRDRNVQEYFRNRRHKFTRKSIKSVMKGTDADDVACDLIDKILVFGSKVSTFICFWQNV